MKFHARTLRHSTLILIALFSNAFLVKGGDINGSMNYGGKNRTYILHIPVNYNASIPTPLVLAFHGLTGTGSMMSDITQFSPLADQEKFIVVYPDGIGKKWATPNSPTDDVGFISALIDKLSDDYNIDASRVFATGASNGGMFTYRLGLELSTKITAIGVVSGYLPNYSSKSFPVPTKPVPVVHFHGTADGIIPYSEGEQATDYWVGFDECSPQADVIDMPNIDPSDGTTVDEMMYKQGMNNSEVQLYKITNGGHTWPGTDSHAMPGLVSQDIDATTIIWNFFKSHSGGSPSNQLPVVSITKPLPNITLFAPASLVLIANASDADGSVTQVEFFNGTKSLKVDNTSSYTCIWKDIAAGVYTVTAKATDNKGAVSSDEVIVTVKPLKISGDESVEAISPFYNADNKSLVVLKPDQLAEYDLQLYAVNGKKVADIPHVNESTETFSCVSFDAGIYFYRITASDQSVVSGKFIIAQ
jgi:polyhydroxybutyrate depolymerase